jgi:hypothetical protein
MMKLSRGKTPMKKIYTMLPVLMILAALCAPAFAAPVGNPVAAQQNSVAAGSLIPTTTYNKLNSFSATSGASAGFVLVFDATAAPSDGTVTPKNCYELPANTTLGVSWGDYPEPFTTGIVLVFSTTGCFIKTISNTAFFSVQAQ